MSEINSDSVEPFRLEPHSCVHCQQIIITPPPSFSRFVDFTQRLPHTRAEYLEALQAGCPVFKIILKNCISRSYSRAQELMDELSRCAGSKYALYETQHHWFQKSIIEFARLMSPWPFAVELRAWGRAEFTCAGGSSGELRVTCEPDDPAAFLFHLRPLNRAVGSAAALEQASSWVRECVESSSQHDPKHLLCSPPADSRVAPTRLVKLAILNGELSVRLYETRFGEQLRYACLSYCWGGDQPAKTIKASYDSYLQTIPISMLPKTLQDAVTVTYSLGLSFLWIDCLCIIQDDETDMTAQLALLPSTYSNSHVTICASSVRICNGGFLAPRSHLQGRLLAEDLRLRYRCVDGRIGSIILSEDIEYDTAEDPINSRAWTLQEFLLSPRILDFGTRQLRWHCRSRRYFDGGLPENTFMGSPKRKEGRGHLIPIPYRRNTVLEVRSQVGRFLATGDWIPMVQNYTQRDLSLPGDKLVAIAALASEIGRPFHLTYLAGLWLESLPWQLLWQISTHQARQPRPVSYRAPSWSWASVDGGIYIPRAVDGVVLEVLDHCIELVHESFPYGEVNGGHLIVKGPLLEGKWLYNRECTIIIKDLVLSRAVSDLSIFRRNHMVDDFDKQALDYASICPDAVENGWDLENRDASVEVQCLLVASYDSGIDDGKFYVGLLLVPQSGEDPDGYVRVGCFCFGPSEDDYFRNAVSRNIKIY